MPLDPSVAAWRNRGLPMGFGGGQGLGVPPLPTPEMIPAPQAEPEPPPLPKVAGPAVAGPPPPLPTTGYQPPQAAGSTPGMAPTPPSTPSPLVAPGAFTPAGPSGPATGALPGFMQGIGGSDPALKVLRNFAQATYGSKLGDQPKDIRSLPPLQPSGGGIVMGGPGGGATLLTPVMHPDGSIEMVSASNPGLKAAPMELGALGMMDPASVARLMQSELQKGVDVNQMSPNNMSPDQAMAQSILSFKRSQGVMSPDEKLHAQNLESQGQKLTSGEKIVGMETKSKEQIAREENVAKLEAARIAAQSAHLGAIAPFIAAGHQGPQLRQDIKLLTDAQKQYTADKGPPLTGAAPSAGGSSPMGVPPELGGIGSATPPLPTPTGPPLQGTPPPIPGQPPPDNLIPPPVPQVKEADDIVNKYTGSNMRDVIRELQRSPTMNTPEGQQLIATRLQQLQNKGSTTEMKRALARTIIANINQVHSYDAMQVDPRTGYAPLVPKARTYNLGSINAAVNPQGMSTTTSVSEAAGGNPIWNAWHANLPLGRSFSGQGDWTNTYYRTTRDEQEAQARAAAAIHQLLSQAAQQPGG